MAAIEEVDEVRSAGETLPPTSLRNSLLSDTSVLQDSFPDNDGRTLERLGDLVPTDLDPESRSLSIDSAYGTLSPESLIAELDLKGQVSQSEGEDTDAGEEEVGFEDDEDAEDEDSMTWNGSQITVNESYILDDYSNNQTPGQVDDKAGTSQVTGCRSHMLRRRSPIQPRPDYLQHFTLRSRSEDDLLQCITGPLQPSDRSIFSRSLTHLAEQTSHAAERSQTDQETTALSSKVKDNLSRAEAGHVQRTLSCPNGQTDCKLTDIETLPPDGLEEKGTLVLSQQPRHQQKKLTVAQLHRIRATMVLNSTLTAS